jgi:energy-coupling factor transport system ATP-binding protein
VASSCAAEHDFALRAEALACALPGDERPVLREVDLRLRAGECALLTGPTGSGKSTLLRALAHALPPGSRAAGRVLAARRPALLLQNVETQLLFTRVDEEVASGIRRGAPEASARRVAELLGRVGLAGFEARGVDSLSAGEQQRVVLAALLAGDPGVLLLDEPTSALDPAARERLAGLLAELKARGHAILVADHLVAPFRAIADRCFTLEKGRLCELEALPIEAPPRRAPPPPLAARAPEVARCDGLGVRDAGGRALLDGVCLRVRRGERVLVSGANGSGKTSLLRALAGLLPPSDGRVARAPGPVGFLFQSPERNLFERSAAEEVAFALRRLGRGEAAIARRVRELLALCELAGVGGRSPLRLSFGEQHRLAVAAALAPEPVLLLADEPFAGLDVRARARLLEVLAGEQERCGSALVLATHDAQPLAGFAHRRVQLRDGRLADA